MKVPGKRSAGKLHAAFDEAGAGNVMMEIQIEDQSENNGVTTESLDKRASSRPYL